MKKGNFMQQLFFVTLGVAILLYIISKIIGLDTTPHNVFDGGSAYYNSKQFVKKILKAPSTAKFDDPCNSCAVKQGDGTWIIKSYVDAQNTFGAMLRQNYECHLSYDPGSDMVNCLSVKFVQ